MTFLIMMVLVSRDKYEWKMNSALGNGMKIVSVMKREEPYKLLLNAGCRKSLQCYSFWVLLWAEENGILQ